MRRGVWHQCGDKSQRMVVEQLEQGAGVGVVISPRDLAMHKAAEYAPMYRERGAQVLIDQQFYEPTYTNDNLASYPTSEFRTTVSELHRVSDDQLDGIAAGLHQINHALATDAVLAPALVYQAGRPDIAAVNARLFGAAKRVGDNLGVPTYATVVLERASTATSETIGDLLSIATSLEASGWYFAFEFEPERLPSDPDAVYRCCSAGLTLACSGLPVLHAYAGPMALLSLAFGATGTAIGHSQNLWKFSRGRWQPPTGQGGGGAAPPRFFSTALWGTIVHPDETAQLSQDLQDRVLTHSPFSGPVRSGTPWGRWDANKHLIHAVATSISAQAQTEDARVNAQAAIETLSSAVELHGDIIQSGLTLTDNTNAYQAQWGSALDNLLTLNDDDYDLLSMLL